MFFFCFIQAELARSCQAIAAVRLFITIAPEAQLFDLMPKTTIQKRGYDINLCRSPFLS